MLTYCPALLCIKQGLDPPSCTYMFFSSPHVFCPQCARWDCACTCQPPECDSFNCLCFEIKIR
uniref:Uncharacterized protein n=1 Tax=Myripristis murdjan TaxID=586833 RepID=A0A667YRZ3_9TELE